MKNAQYKKLDIKWKQIIIETLDIKIGSIFNNGNSNHLKNSGSNRIAKNQLQNLHDSYVITPIYKITQNLGFICQIFYALLQVKELGIVEDSSSNQNTYVSVTKSKNNIDNHHETFLRRNLTLL